NLAMRDSLTGLYNRRFLLEEAANQVKSWSSDQHQNHWLALLDLDSFKNINDSFGHDFGDAVLKSFAQHLTVLAGDKDIVARLGGDEFCIVFCQREEDQVVKILEELLQTIQSSPVTHDDENQTMKASIGVAPLRDGNLAEALKTADLRLYSAKRTGRGQLVFTD
ncbi:MAG: GGDEF domain-containing protein, partial [Roseibium sp.]|uniref:GGDEF domain-containing protein n=1 Tax=Roseibium sp. TaxID=1936156 RepID=UPI002613F7AE